MADDDDKVFDNDGLVAGVAATVAVRAIAVDKSIDSFALVFAAIDDNDDEVADIFLQSLISFSSFFSVELLSFVLSTLFLVRLFIFRLLFAKFSTCNFCWFV